MCFNKCLRLVICLDCGVAITSKNIIKHVHDSHSELSVRFDNTQLSQIIEELGVLDSYSAVNIPAECSPFEGLHLTTDAYLCTECPHIRGTCASIQTHFITSHDGSNCPTTWERITAQQLNYRNKTPFFRVRVPPSPSTDSVLENYLTELDTERQKSIKAFDQSKVDPRQISPWLRATRWHEHVATFDHSHLMSLVAYPSKSESTLQVLAKAVESYTQQSDDAIDTLSTIALQVINSPIAGFGSVLVPWYLFPESS